MINRIIEKIIGYILLTPAVLSVASFISSLILKKDMISLLLYPKAEIDSVQLQYYIWIGSGSTPALPLYFGLMALAGVYLIKEKEPHADRKRRY